MGNAASMPKWQQERDQTIDHTFNYIDAEEVKSNRPWLHFTYSFIFIAIVKAFVVYMADIFSVVLLFKPLALKSLPETSGSSAAEGLYGQRDTVGFLRIDVQKWIYLGAVSISILLLLWDMRKAKKVIATRDIAFALANLIAYRYYSMRNYGYYCLFQRITNALKRKDKIAFFVFYQLKGKDIIFSFSMSFFL